MPSALPSSASDVALVFLECGGSTPLCLCRQRRLIFLLVPLLGGLVTNAAIGFRAHSGWAAVVALCVTKGAPCVLARNRVHLVETFTYEFRQPYHTAEKMPPDEALAFVSRMEAESRRLAHRAIEDMQKTLSAQGYELTRCGLVLASGRTLPALPQILASHALIHTADGELFRGALLHASARCGLASKTAKERELPTEAARILRLRPADLARRIVELGRPLGAPWSQDEKLAALAAWFALAAPGRYGGS